MNKIVIMIFELLFSATIFAQGISFENKQPREHLLMDFGWRFALGHSYDTRKDFDNGSGYFSYFAKAGYGDGAAAKNFDDRAWRKLDLPHDWCVELPFDSTGGHSHGYKAIGRNFPENSVGWYRKNFFIPASDTGKRISIEFDGVHRNSIVWVNGFYLGTEHSGYKGFSYDITDYLNYGGENVVAVRVDATMEEGWFYEGAGIYRHAWLTKTSPLFVARYGTFVTTELKENNAVITTRTTVQNESGTNSTFDIEETIVDADGKTIISGIQKQLNLKAGTRNEFYNLFKITNPELWSIENPFLHKLKTVIKSDGKIVDNYETTFGIRTVRFDPDSGFFLNGKNIKIKGTNDHQDHAGVGTAIPDALQEFRIKRLKEMGSNAIRTSHNPPTPEFLDACDRLGMMVLDENRLMGINDEHLNCLESMIRRDRNHPCVILWSLGNEEWSIEGNITGARITTTMQNFADRLDSTRSFTAASSGGWDYGVGSATRVMGYNYLAQGNMDEHHAKFPHQPGVATEETTAGSTRGVYQEDRIHGHMAFNINDIMTRGTEFTWKYYLARPYIAGVFYWTGFDYRGEPNPIGWPQVTSQYGILDLCGFPKDNFYYLKSWWGTEPVLHLLPHWKGKEGKEINVTVNSNCEQVELFLNNKSLGKKDMQINSHLAWNVNYEPGVLTAVGFKSGKEILKETVKTVRKADAIQLIADRTLINADGDDVSVITVQINDKDGEIVPFANNEISFSLEGNGKIIGVGNGDPASHEREKFFETIKISKIVNLKELPVSDLNNRPEVSAGFIDTNWKPAFTNQPEDWQVYIDTLIVVRGTFELPEINNEADVNLFTKSITENQSIYVNGHLIAANIVRNAPNQSYHLDHSIIKTGRNEYAITGKRFRKISQWDEPNTDPGLVQVIYPPEQWKRKAFNGLAQVIIQSSQKQGEIILRAASTGLKPALIKIQTETSVLKPAVNN